MSVTKCPECRTEITDTDWFYTRNLFDPEGDPQKEKCPHCGRFFMIKSYSVIDHYVCTVDDYEEYGDFV